MGENTLRKAIWIMGLFVVVARADDVTIPNTFSAGAPAVAAEVNENFSAVEASVDDNAADIDALRSDVDSNSAAVGELFTGIAGIAFGYHALDALHMAQAAIE